jgi:hypothetical protein
MMLQVKYDETIVRLSDLEALRVALEDEPRRPSFPLEDAIENLLELLPDATSVGLAWERSAGD